MNGTNKQRLGDILSREGRALNGVDARRLRISRHRGGRVWESHDVDAPVARVRPDSYDWPPSRKDK